MLSDVRDGRIGWRCPAEPGRGLCRQGGQTRKRRSAALCVCNALMANIGMGQIRAGGTSELPLLTSGNRRRDGGALSSGRKGELQRGSTSTRSTRDLRQFACGPVRRLPTVEVVGLYPNSLSGSSIP